MLRNVTYNVNFFVIKQKAIVIKISEDILFSNEILTENFVYLFTYKFGIKVLTI